jgi:uncharacterized glyoxalase superfamily protein PhnB
MTDFQLGLLLIGAAAVVGVAVYNRLQERSVRRQAERAFGSAHADVLLEPAPGRQEPTLESPPARGPGIQGDAMPDSRVDYVINLDAARGVAGSLLLAEWGALEHRFTRRVMLAGTDGEGWRRVAPGDSGRFIALQAALQMVSRDGVVAEAQLLEFRSLVETLGAKIGATLAAPEMRQALEAARELDGICADADIQVALHVVGFSFSEGSDWDQQPFRITPREDGVTLALDVAHTLEPGRAYEAMARAGAQLASTHEGRVVDDNGNALDARGLASIAAQIDTVRQALAARGIEPGSPLALRLFS